jgi:homoserine kinase
MSFSDEFRLAVFIPDFEVSTAKARSILPDSYPRHIAVNNASKAILTVHALENGDLDLLKEVARDEIHEPYRKKLIHEFDELQKIYQEDTDGILLISGYGSTCFGIARKEFSASGINKLSDLKHNWNYRPVSISHKGAELI